VKQDLAAALERNDVAAAPLEVEMTESAMIGGHDKTSANSQRLLSAPSCMSTISDNAMAQAPLQKTFGR
jgi:EAL domain-containing protein (putative c-di-GMP-specific phosphodiesterase class I)